MLGIHDIVLFIVSGLILNITPGQDFFYVVSRSASGGFRVGSVAALGVGAGCFVHMTCAALGLSAILAASATAYAVVKTVGAVYLVWVGLSMIRSAGAKDAPTQARTSGSDLGAVFRQGFLTNALNPKVALFFLAFLPQFVETGAPHKALAFLLLGAVFNFNGTLWFLFVAWSTARLSGMVQGTGRYGLWVKRAAGLLFIAFGLRLALSEGV